MGIWTTNTSTPCASSITSNKTSTTVDAILQYSGADKLRVYPALFELEQAGQLEVLEREELGAPRVVRLVQT